MVQVVLRHKLKRGTGKRNSHRSRQFCIVSVLWEKSLKDMLQDS